MKPWTRPAIVSNLYQLKYHQNEEYYIWDVPLQDLDSETKKLGWEKINEDNVDSNNIRILYKHPNYKCGFYLTYDTSCSEATFYREDRFGEPNDWEEVK